MRLIDADELIVDIKNAEKSYRESKMLGEHLYPYKRAFADGTGTVADLIVADAPTVEERKHGHWIRADKRFWECSECHYEKHIRRISEAGMYKTPYCPYCGAVMDEEMQQP